MSALPLSWRQRAGHRARSAAIATACAALCAAASAQASPAPVVEAKTSSSLDAPLFYQLLIGELELRSGAAGSAYQVMLDAARRTREEALFRRTVEIALQGRAGDQALAAASAWRLSLPQSSEAPMVQIQLLAALNKPAEAQEPIGALLKITPAADRPNMIASLPRALLRATDKRQAATMLEAALKPYADTPATRTASQVAEGRMWLLAGDAARAAELAASAHADDPSAPGPALLALDLMASTPGAESVVTHYLQQPKAEFAVRLGYARALAAVQRYADALAQLEQVTREQPELISPWLTVGALYLDLHQPKEAETALQRYVQLTEAARAPAAADAPAAGEDDQDDDAAATPVSADRGLVRAWLLLSQAAEMRGDYAVAEQWLNKIDGPQRTLDVQGRRAALLARQGKLRQARELLQALPEPTPEDARAKLLTEAQVLRDVKQWREAEKVLNVANQRFPNDADLLYEQAMAEEKLDRLDDMERLLRKVIEIKPDHQHAYNALGYSLAERNVRLPEAKALIEKALALAPGEPFITDSLGWVEYRLGRRSEALQHLHKAYAARPDVEIAAHLAEVLWVDGQRDEARNVLRDARKRDPANEVLVETLTRLKVDL